MQQIPLSQLPAQTFNVVLGGQNCTIALYWRQERLYLDLSVGAIAICQGAICQNRANVLQSKTKDFSGTLHFFDLEGDRPPHWQGLHTGAADSAGRWILVYLEANEAMPQKLRY